MSGKKEKTAKEKSEYRILFFCLTAVAAMMGVVWSATNLGYDGTYQIAMGWRLVQGDRMLQHMWEPHQTSAFLCGALIALYKGIFHTTTGVVLFLQMTGMAIRGGLSILFYHVLRQKVRRPVAYFAALLLFMVSPKDYALPDFGNMQLWSGILLVVFLWLYLLKEKTGYSVMSAVAMCLLVLAYPGCLVVFPVVCFLIYRYFRENAWKNLGIFAGICVCIGAVYTGFVLWSAGGVESLMENLAGMLSLEPTHTVGAGEKLWLYLLDFLKWSLAAALAVFTGKIVEKTVQKKKEGLGGIWMAVTAGMLLVGFFWNIVSVGGRYDYGMILMCLVAAGVCFSGKYLKGTEEYLFWLMGTAVGISCVVATLIMTDLPFVTAMPYGIVAASLALIPLEKWWKMLDSRKVRRILLGELVCFVLLLAFRGLYIRTPITGRGQIMSTIQGVSPVRKGPAAGIITDKLSAAMERDGVADFQEKIVPGSKIWIVDGVVNSLGYLYQDVEVGAPTVMSTPYYCEEITAYWERNPEKYPDVVVVSAYGGELSYDVRSSEWFMKWLEQDFCPSSYEDGVFWRFYYR